LSIFSHDVYENVRTRVIVLHEGRMLLLSPHQLGDGWRLPGGGLEMDESLYECGEREVLEETGVLVKVTRVAFLREWVVPKYCTVPKGEGTGYGLEVYLYAHPTTEWVEPRPEHPQAQIPRWFLLAQVPELPLWPKELKTLAAQMAAGGQPRGVPSFVSDYESPDVPAPDADFG
jgi:8-oxo-dGTP pyrophosphatase MutT (NUDIX family)